jgi:hypothetical protein
MSTKQQTAKSEEVYVGVILGRQCRSIDMGIIAIRDYLKDANATL